MFRFLCFLCGFALISQTFRVCSQDVLFESKGVPVDGVVFRDTGIARKAQKMCNKYTVQACKGRLRVFTSMQFVPPDSSLSFPTTLLPNDDLNETNDFSQLENDETVTVIPNPLPRYTVVGGKISFSGQYPHMSLIGFGEYSKVQWLCGGSLISEQYVLSAAHCSSVNGGSARWIRLGELDLAVQKDQDNAIDFAILQTFIHPEYRPPFMYNDIVLFRFRGLVSFSAYIRPICLNTLHDFKTAAVTAIGWGATGYGERESSKLLNVNLDIQDDNICDSIYKGEKLPYGFNTSTMICVGFAAGGKDTCQGDSGGPLQIYKYNAGCPLIYSQVGIVSFGEGCAFPNTPAVYTRVSFFINWIESIVWK